MQRLAMLLVLVAIAQTANALRCVHSGMCSLGQVKPFVGDISDTKGLKAAAQARSFNNEIIIHMTFANRILDVKLLLGNWARLGIEHVLLIGNSNDTCPVVAQQLPHVGCAWYTSELPITSPKYRAYHWRYRTLARLVRMGYNVYLADTDIVVFDDPYRYWKSPPFSNYTIINQPEMLSRYDSYETNDNVNAGNIYVQNVRRDGVAAWLLAEVTDRYLRWADDDYALLLSKNVTLDAGIMDQSALNDALTSVATGFPHFLHTISGFYSSYNEALDVIRRNVSDQVNAKWHYDSLELPHFMQAVAGDKTTNIKWLSMLMPHTEGVWPEEYGGRWYPEKRGNLSTAFMTLLKEDCDGCALWPDIEDNTTIAAARAVPIETYMYAPPWLMCGYNARGTNGAWLPDATGSVAQVVGHANYMPPSKTVHKLMWRQWFGQYDWSIAEEHWGTPYVFQANMQQQEKTLRDPTPLIEDQASAPRLLVFFSSHMRLQKLHSMQEYITVVKGAMQVAALSNRTLVFPDMPCNVSFVGKVDEGLFTPKIASRENQWYPYGTQENMRCIMAYLTVPQCLVDRRGLLGSEYEHFVQKFGVTYDLEPNKGNTVFFPASGELRSTLSTRNGPASVIVEVAEHDAQAHMDTMALTQVVFLAHPVKVAGYSLGNWTCLNKATIKQIKELMGKAYNQSSNIQVLKGRVVAGRLTTEGGLSEAPGTPLNVTRTAATMNYAGRLQTLKTDPTSWCKPGAVQAGVGAGKWTTNRRVRRVLRVPRAA